MKFTKILSLLLAVLMIAALFVGCTPETKPTDAQTEKQTEKQTEAQTEAQTDAPATTEAPAAEVYVEVNGEKIVLGVPFEELKDKLPAETQPAETIDSCDPDSDWKQTIHYYNGFVVKENKDGVATAIEVSEGEYAVNGKIKIGSTRDEVKALLGEPDDDTEWGLYYTSTMPLMTFFLDEETGLVTGFGVMTEFSI